MTEKNKEVETYKNEAVEVKNTFKLKTENDTKELTTKTETVVKERDQAVAKYNMRESIAKKLQDGLKEQLEKVKQDHEVALKKLTKENADLKREKKKPVQEEFSIKMKP